MADGIYGTKIPRRCAWKRNGQHCITILHSSNPGPFCECHERIAAFQRRHHRRIRDALKNAQHAADLAGSVR